jgi:hypothetical protein
MKDKEVEVSDLEKITLEGAFLYFFTHYSNGLYFD